MTEFIGGDRVRWKDRPGRVCGICRGPYYLVEFEDDYTYVNGDQLTKEETDVTHRKVQGDQRCE